MGSRVSASNRYHTKLKRNNQSNKALVVNSEPLGARQHRPTKYCQLPHIYLPALLHPAASSVSMHARSALLAICVFLFLSSTLPLPPARPPAPYLQTLLLSSFM